MGFELSNVPEDPVQREGYQELYEFWCKIHESLEHGKWRSSDDSEFKHWDQSVLDLLTGTETMRFDKPLRPHLAQLSDCASGSPHARMFHLTKILWARHGIEEHMEDTGY